jgi:hypothetical protein
VYNINPIFRQFVVVSYTSNCRLAENHDIQCSGALSSTLKYKLRITIRLPDHKLDGGGG